jgi:hypothetical protein
MLRAASPKAHIAQETRPGFLAEGSRSFCDLARFKSTNGGPEQAEFLFDRISILQESQLQRNLFSVLFYTAECSGIL